MGTGPPPGCSAFALVSTWLCPLSASQRAAEWGSIETNSFCQTQLMGLPRPGKKGAAVGLWLLILLRKHARNLPPGICSMTITNPPPPLTFSPPPPPLSQAHLLLCTHGYILRHRPTSIHPSTHPPTRTTHPQGQTGDRGVALWLSASLAIHKKAQEKIEGV